MKHWIIERKMKKKYKKQKYIFFDFYHKFFGMRFIYKKACMVIYFMKKIHK